MRWSYAGPIAGMRCTQIREPSEPFWHTWNDNYLCLPSDSPYQLSWHYAGISNVRGSSCVRWLERADPHTWHDNYLCYTEPPRGLSCLEPRSDFCSSGNFDHPIVGSQTIILEALGDDFNIANLNLRIGLY